MAKFPFYRKKKRLDTVARKMKKRWIYGLSIGGYALLAIYLFYPMLAHPLSRVITYPNGETTGDQWFVLWNLWWIKYSLLNLKTNPFITHYIFYPNVSSLVMSELCPLLGLASVPFQLLLPGARGLTLSYNFLFILNFLLSAISMFILVKALTHSSTSAFICGLIFVLLPVRLLHSIHLQNLTLEFIPLYVLFFYKTLISAQWRNVFAAALCVLLVVWTCLQYVPFLVLLSGFFLICWMIFNFQDIGDKQRILRLSALVVLCFLALLPNLLMYMKTPPVEAPPFEDTLYLAPDLMGFIIPPEFYGASSLLRKLPTFQLLYRLPITAHFTYLGITLIIFACIGIVKAPKKQVLPWMLSAVFFLVLSLGPYLIYNGELHKGIPLPYLFLYNHLPLFHLSRAPYRFVIVAELFLLVVAGFGVKALLEKGKKDSRKIFVFSCLIVLVLLDYKTRPYATLETTVPPIYERIAREPGNFAVFDEPFGLYADRCRYMFYQTTHHRPIWHGMTSRTCFIKRVAIRDQLLQNKNTILPTDRQALHILSSFGTLYLIQHGSTAGEQSGIKAVYRLQ